MTRAHPWLRFALVLAAGVGISLACHDEDDGFEQAGEACEVPDTCYSGVADADLALLGEVICLDKVEGGYCTHLCESDEDCCAVDGECQTDLPQVCSPYESTGMKMCFLSCESDDLGGKAPENYCEEFAHPAFHCHSSGGGSENRKVCT